MTDSNEIIFLIFFPFSNYSHWKSKIVVLTNRILLWNLTSRWPNLSIVQSARHSFGGDSYRGKRFPTSWSWRNWASLLVTIYPWWGNRSKELRNLDPSNNMIPLSSNLFSELKQLRSVTVPQQDQGNIQIFVQSDQYKLRRNCISNNWSRLVIIAFIQLQYSEKQHLYMNPKKTYIRLDLLILDL